METKYINLQNTETPENIVVSSVSFDSDGIMLKGTLYSPTGSGGPLPAVVVTGAWTTVKEQMPGTYARELAARGMIALAFDFEGWGESEGDPRFVENPATKTANIFSAAKFLSSLPEVRNDKISGLGICASSGYMASAVADSEYFEKVALVAPWLHDPVMAQGIYGGPDAVSQLIATSEADNAAETILLGASSNDTSSVMYQAPYYTEKDRGLISEYDNKFSAASWKPWLTYDAQESADRLFKPLLLVGSPGIALPAGAEAYENRTTAPLEKVWLDGDVSQFDFYDRVDVVNAAADAVATFFHA